MATREEKNTITNIFRIRALEEEINYSDFYNDKELGKVFNSKSIEGVVSDTQPPVNLWHDLWYQGEMACLFGEPNVGKTILAMKIATDVIKRGQDILYFDFENAEHQLLPRYKGEDKPLVSILSLNYANKNINKDNRSMLSYIKRQIILRRAHIIVIDDITHLFGSGNQADVRYVLNELRSWTKYLRVSILVLAHSKKKGLNQLANIEQLAGSFECAYSFDSIFSLNKANRFNDKERGISHYIKQHKTRMGQIRYDEENVITLKMRFDDDTKSLSMCDLCENGNERQLIRDFGYYTDQEIIAAIIAFKEKFYSIREISEMVGVSKSQVHRLLKEHYTPHKPQHDDERKPLPPVSEEELNPYPINSHVYLDEGEEALLYGDDTPISYAPYYPPGHPYHEDEQPSQLSQESLSSQESPSS
ncbi:MAG: AAA family ATPase [Muribaculaceae bacterium]|nr:AAA family ATPase [Muribaculaceae bacterium]MBR6432413.1 AAA family ATPase [Muribaculaceae bacterium]